MGPLHHHKPGTEAGRGSVLGTEVCLSVSTTHASFAGEVSGLSPLFVGTKD